MGYPQGSAHRRTRWGAAVSVMGVIALAACSPSTPQTAPSQTTAGTPVFCFAQSQASDPALTKVYQDAAQAAAQRGEGDKTVRVHDIVTGEKAKDTLDAAKKAGCGVIATTSAAMANAAKAAASANPEIVYEVVGVAPGEKTPPNLVPVNLGFDQPGFLAGYLAAATTRSGILGVVSASTDRSRVAEGFAAGVDFYNQAKGTGIVVQGWNAATQQAGAATSAEEVSGHVGTYLSQGADIILVDADAYSPAALKAVTDAQADASLIFVGADAYETTPEAREHLMTSLVPEPEPLVAQLLRVAGQRTIPEGTDIGFTVPLASAKLADLREWGVRVSDELQADLDGLAKQLRDGDITIGEAR